MHAANKKSLTELASNLQADPIAAAINKLAAEEDNLVLAFLTSQLKASGFTVTQKKLKVLTQVEILKDGALVASGSSDTGFDALLHAALGYLREVAAATAKPQENLSPAGKG